MIKRDEKLIETIVSRGVERIFPHEDFLRSRLSSGEQLRIYLGIDPTGPTLHLGHMIPLMKLAQLQEAGHKVILLIGDFTARIGDPDKSQVRKPLSHEEVLENAKRYQEQASIFLRFDGDNPAELRYNSEWLDHMRFADVLSLASQMTVQRMLDRDMFRRRIDAGNPVYIHEFMYPLMQGYDSVALNVDGEVGGNDQTFNMLVGRDLLKNQNPPKEKFIIPMKLLVDGKGEKMGKTTGNMLSFLDDANTMFRKIVSWPDETLLLSFELLTDFDLSEITNRLASGENPLEIKFDLAHDIVKRFYGENSAKKAKEVWLHEVREDALPENIPEITLLDSFLETLGEASGESKKQLKRLLHDGAIKVNGTKIFDEDYILNVGDIVQIGKKRWYKIITT